MSVELAKLLVLAVIVLYLGLGPVRAKLVDASHHRRARQDMAEIKRMQSSFPPSKDHVTSPR